MHIQQTVEGGPTQVALYGLCIDTQNGKYYINHKEFTFLMTV